MALSVFISYARKDRALREELDEHLSNLKRQNIISSWHDGDILPGTPWQSQIEEHLKSADIILLLISSDFIHSDFCYSVQLKEAIARHHAHQAHVIPILLRPVYWEGAPFADLEMLPTGAKAVIQWPSHDEAFADVVQGIKRVVSATPPNNALVSPVPPVASTTQAMPQSAFRPVPPKPMVFKIPEAGKHFLEKQDRSWIINMVDNMIGNMAIGGIKNLLRGILPDQLINSINYRDATRNIADTIIDFLEMRGTLNPPRSHTHALGAFLRQFLEDDSIGYDAQINIIVLLFRYILLTDRQQIETLSARFQIPSPMLIDQQLISHPFTLAPSYSNLASAGNGQERIERLYNQRRYLLDVKFLSEGAKSARSVCRIDFDMHAEGTGFLIAPDLILTNYHVMIPPGFTGDVNARAQQCEVKFGIIEGEKAGPHFTLHPTDWRQAESKLEELDFMVLKLNREVTDDQMKPLALQANAVQKDAFVNIIQHPTGQAMAVSLRFNQVVDIDEQRIYYLADTEEGSSGSPVFDDRWRLVALHHAGGKNDATGKLLIAANIGIPIHLIIHAIRAQIPDLLITG
ncbi:MAG TPA: trypsin-like peptidase domain-containing protein [Ktedonobacteraceae bacterium]|jgi:hypothetical protein